MSEQNNVIILADYKKSFKKKMHPKKGWQWLRSSTSCTSWRTRHFMENKTGKPIDHIK